MLNIAPILRFFHQQENIIILVQQYFYGLSWSVLPSIWYICCSQFIVAINKPKTVLLWTLISIPCTLIPGYGLLFGKFGLPAIGISGIAYANSFASYFILLLVILYLRDKEFKNYHIFSWQTKINTKVIAKLFSLGYPISVQFGVELAAFSISAIFFGWLGEDALAAFQAVIQFNMIIIMIPYGFAQSSAILIGQALGRNEKSVTKLLGNAALIMGIVFMLLIAAAYLLMPKTLMSMYLDTQNPANFYTINIAVILFAISAFSQLFDGIRNIVTGSLRGFHDTKSPMLVGILATCVINIPVGYFLAFPLHLGPAGLSLGFALGVTLGAFVLLRRFYKKASIVG
jgi:MATE family multidrug resistance protein